MRVTANSLSTVGNGLSFLCLGSIFKAMAFAGPILCAFIDAGRSYHWLVPIFFVLSFMLDTVGSIWCVTAPSDSNAGPIFLLAILVDMVSLLLGVLLPVEIARLPRPSAVIAPVLFVEALRRLAKFLGQPAMVRSCWSVMVMILLVFVLLIVTRQLDGIVSERTMWILGVIDLIMGLAAWFRSLGIMIGLRRVCLSDGRSVKVSA